MGDSISTEKTLFWYRVLRGEIISASGNASGGGDFIMTPDLALGER